MQNGQINNPNQEAAGDSLSIIIEAINKANVLGVYNTMELKAINVSLGEIGELLITKPEQDEQAN